MPCVLPPPFLSFFSFGFDMKEFGGSTARAFPHPYFPPPVVFSSFCPTPPGTCKSDDLPRGPGREPVLGAIGLPLGSIQQKGPLPYFLCSFSREGPLQSLCPLAPPTLHKTPVFPLGRGHSPFLGPPSLPLGGEVNF